MKQPLATLSLLLLLSGVALGESKESKNGQKRERQKGPRQSEFVAHFFERLDANEDGGVSPAEFASNPRLEQASEEQRKSLFQRLDKNGDGLIQPTELKPPKKGEREGPEWLKDGPVDYEKFSQLPRVQKLTEEMKLRLFERMDQNGDGLLSREDGPPPNRGERPDGRRKDGPPRGPIALEKLDTDEDGKVSFPEFQAAPFHLTLSEDEAEDRFETLDSNDDGSLSVEELTKREPKDKEKKRKPQREATD